MTGTQAVLLTTPLDVLDGSRCGKIVFSDLHVSSDSSSAIPEIHHDVSGRSMPASRRSQPTAW